MDPFPLQAGRMAKEWPAHRVDRRRLPCHALVLVERGRGRLEADGAAWDVAAPQMIALRAGQRHSYWARPRWSERWITFAGDPALLPARMLIDLAARPALATALRRAIDAQLAGDARLARTGLAYVLAECAAGPDAGADPLLARVESLAGAEPGRFTPATLARDLGMPYPTLRRRWLRAHGSSIQDWLLARRLGIACRVLAGGGDVAAAARASGFASADAFSRRFRQRFGIRPRDYRGSALA